jgi:hypothetical protein
VTREEIKHAAVKAVGGFICIGKSHADCFLQGKHLGLTMSNRSKDQGFMTNRGRFVGRVDAARIAKRAKQIIRDGRRQVSALLSEDIWYREDILYCPIRGYVRITQAKGG